MSRDTDILIIGAGPAGLVLALSMKQIGVDCRVYEAVPELDELGLVDELSAVAVTTKDASYFNRYGQLIYTEPAGKAAGYPWPQFSIHRGDMQMVFKNAVEQRLGPESIVLGHRCIRV